MRFKIWHLIRAVLAGGGLLLSVSIAGADAPMQGGIKVTDAWIRWIPANLPNAGFMTLQNTGNEIRVLTGATSVDYQDIHIHQSVQQQGIMSMRAVTSIEIKPHARVDFAQAGYHFMLMQSKRALHVGDHVTITLRFEHGAPIDADFIVRQESTS